MPRVDGETEAGAGLPGEGGEHLRGRLDRRPASLAHEVAVGRRGQMVGGRPVAEVGVDYHTEALELVEVAVDGGHVDVRHPPLHD